MRDHGVLHAQLRERGVNVIDLNRSEGAYPGHFLRLVRALRGLRPHLVHTRNLGGLEGQLAAFLAGVRLRVHGEYGREPAEPCRSRPPSLVRRAMRPLVGHYVASSIEQERWLIEQVGAEPARVSHISNGVDSLEFHPRHGAARRHRSRGFHVP
ncbi:glycosyltransferase [Massilia sp. Se16.2.3]|uniref:glycosyltransferase n=1 Tax=Massilia sp. Se16.2.3 TaxID=2709303 RepID=UPI001E627BB3|nr:glycosyltransferase [Massilia sp. Se16.2.3]